MPIIKDETEGKHRLVTFELRASGSTNFPTLPLTSSINRFVDTFEDFSLQKPYKINEIHFSKIVDMVLLSDTSGNTVQYSSLINYDEDRVRIEPDFNTQMSGRLFSKFKKYSIQPSRVWAGTYIKTARLQDLGFSTTPVSLIYEITYQIFFDFLSL